MTHPGSDSHAPGAQPEPTPGAWTPPQGGYQGAPQQEPAKSGTKKWLGVAGAVLVAGVGGAYLLTGGFGIGAPSVGDCIEAKGEHDFAVVGCGADEADYKIIGIEDEKQTEAEFWDATDTCAEFESVEAAYWESAGMITEKGTVYCVGPI